MKRTLRHVLAAAGAAIVAAGGLAACSDRAASPVQPTAGPAYTSVPTDTAGLNSPGESSTQTDTLGSKGGGAGPGGT